MPQEKLEDLADTEHLIVAYLRSHPPEECMLDKISMGIGKSRATALKYLWTLHAKGVIDYREIGRNKLWMMKESEGAAGTAVIREESGNIPPGARTTVQAAFELHDLMLREEELRDSLDLPETIVLTVGRDLSIVTANRLFESLFPGAVRFSDLVHSSQRARLENLRQTVNSGVGNIGNTGNTGLIELDLMESAGIYRSYHFTLVAAGPGEPAGA